MSYTYNQLLDRMNAKFEEIAGFSPERASDIAVKIRLLAGELYALHTEMDNIKCQMFPNTATGEYLDRHAQQRGISRIKGDKAWGMVIFRLDVPLDHDIVIPQGTVCSNRDGSLRYVTIQDETIPRNTTLKFIECEAENSGTQYNVARDTVKVIITYFSVGMSITNASSFSGGTDDESDDNLRQRLAQSYADTPNGANAAYYVRLATSVDGIQSAAVSGSVQNGSITVCVGGKGDVPSDTAYRNVHDILNVNRPFGIELTVARPELVTADVTVSVTAKDGYTPNEVIANVRQNITQFFYALSVGENVRLAALGKVIYDSEGVDNYTFSNMSDVTVTSTQLAVMGTVSVTVPE